MPTAEDKMVGSAAINTTAEDKSIPIPSATEVWHLVDHVCAMQPHNCCTAARRSEKRSENGKGIQEDQTPKHFFQIVRFD